MNDGEKKKWLDGYETGLTWLDDYEPGGPWIFHADATDKPEFIEQARQSGLENKAWRDGWRVGNTCGKPTGIRFDMQQIEAIWARQERDLQVHKIQMQMYELESLSSRVKSVGLTVCEIDNHSPHVACAKSYTDEAQSAISEALRQLKLSII